MVVTRPRVASWSHAAAGVGVQAIVGVLVLGGIVGFIMSKRKKKPEGEEDSEVGADAESTSHSKRSVAPSSRSLELR